MDILMLAVAGAASPETLEAMQTTSNGLAVFTRIILILLAIVIIYRIVLYCKVARRQRDVIIKLLGGSDSMTSRALATWRDQSPSKQTTARPSSSASTATAAPLTRSIPVRKV